MSKKKLSDFSPQTQNANNHTARGLKLIGNSIQDNGWIGSITVANNNETFDGSARLESIKKQYGDKVEPIIIDSDGTRPVIVRRTDIESTDDPKAKLLSVAANRIAQVNLEWNSDILAEWGEEVDLSGFFADGELDGLMGEATPDFQPTDIENQGKLDEIQPKEISCECPSCGNKFIQIL